MMSEENNNQELQQLITEIRGGWAQIRTLPEELRTLRQQVGDLRRTGLSQRTTRPRGVGEVSDPLARHVAAQFIALCEKSGRIEALAVTPAERDAMTGFAREYFGVATRTALSTTEFPMPSEFANEYKELISDFGVVRKKMVRYPLGKGTARPARVGARPTFGSIAMSAGFGEKSPSVTFASLESHKVGGIVRVPRELDEQSVVALGQFLARYGAVEFARAEDTWGFLADGSATYDSVRGVVQIARDNNRFVQLAATKTKPSDATLDDFRALRRMVNKAALNGRLSAYYLDSTWETRLAGFRTAAEPNIYQRLPDGSAILDGYPIVWSDVLQPYDTAAAADKPIAVFGALGLWWLGEHGSPRIDTSEHVWFANDQLAVRFIEEIDFDYAASDATAALITAAA
jgi:HK97 family phage major capsid protein